MSTDYHTAQGDFSSIVYRLQPMVLSNFVMWLDLKVAEFKVYGQMLLDEQDSNASKWFLQTGLGQDVPPYAKQKKRPSMHTGSTERTKRLATTIVSKPIKHSRIDISDEEENIELKSKSILPLDTSPLQEDFREFQEQVNSFISSSDNQVFQSSSPSSQTSAKTKMITNNNSSIQRDEKHSDQHNIAKHVKKSNSAGSDIMQFHSADSSLSSDFSNISRPTSETSSQKLLSVLPQTSQYDSSHSQNITTCTSSSSTILPPSDTKPVVKIEPDDSEYNQLKMENLEQFSEMPSEDNSSSMYLVPNISVAGETNTDISSRTHTVTHSDGAMYFSTPSDNENLQTDDKSGAIDSVMKDICLLDKKAASSFSGGKSTACFVRSTSSFAVKSSDFVCPQCKCRCADIDNHLDHINMCFGIDKLTCYLCFKRFSGTRDLKDHLIGKHYMVNAYKCLCGKEFRWRGAFIRHRKFCSVVAFTVNE